MRVLAIGDSGVGKTSIMHLLSSDGQVLRNAKWTVGADFFVKAFAAADGSTVLAEIVDVGGTQQHRLSRRVFFRDFDAIVLVYDLTNRKSRDNLNKWLKEAIETKTRLEEESHVDVIVGEPDAALPGSPAHYGSPHAAFASPGAPAGTPASRVAALQQDGGAGFGTPPLHQGQQQAQQQGGMSPLASGVGQFLERRRTEKRLYDASRLPPILIIGNKQDAQAGAQHGNTRPPALLDGHVTDVHHMSMSALRPAFEQVESQFTAFLQHALARAKPSAHAAPVGGARAGGSAALAAVRSKYGYTKGQV